MQKTDFNFEVLIHDDASTDGTTEIIREYEKKYPNIIKPLYEKENQWSKGRRGSIVFNFPRARGKYIALCEGDDFWTDENKLQKQVDFMEARSDYALCFHSVKVFFENFEKQDEIFPVDKTNITLERLLGGNYIQTNSVMYRKQTYEKMAENIMPGDWYMHLYHAQFGKIGFIDEVMSSYRRHSEGVYWEAFADRSAFWRHNATAQLIFFQEILDMYKESKTHKDIILKSAAKAVEAIVDSGGLSDVMIMKYPVFIKELLLEASKKSKAIKQREDQFSKDRDDLTKLRQTTNDLGAELTAIRHSISYKVGRKVLSIPRIFKSVIVRVRNVWGRPTPYMSSYVKDLINQFYYSSKISPKRGVSILLILRDAKYPTSSAFIRLVSPLTSRTFNGKVRFDIIDGSLINEQMVFPDICIIQRTAIGDIGEAKKFIKLAKQAGSKLIVDNDDAFSEIKIGHPQYSVQHERSNSLDYIVENADEVWLSTDKLKKIYPSKKSIVIRNTIDGRLWSNVDKGNHSTATSNQLQIVYMGTKTHDADLNMILPALDALSEKRPNSFELTVIGVSTLEVERQWIKIYSPEQIVYPKFVEWFIKQGPFDIGISPLEDSLFNRNKSDIKCLDYMACGIKPVVSDVEAYANTELDDHIVRVKNNTNGWIRALESEIINLEHNRSNAATRARNAYEYLKSERSPIEAAQLMKETILSADVK